jgi:hypothetical protein
MSPTPPLTPLDDLDQQLAAAGYAVLGAEDLLRLAGNSAAQMQAWLPHWDDLPPDEYLKDGGRYRRRRHGSFVIEADQLHIAPHRAHWQPVSYNALHGGIERWFEPLPLQLSGDAAWARLLVALAARASALRGRQTWYAEAHSFRIDTTDGIGRPTPEGAHRDGVDLVAVMLMARVGIKGAETRVFDARGPQGVRFTLTQPFSTLLLDDERVVHESTPIQPQDGRQPAHRDTLVLTFRRGGFQDP